MWQYEVYGSIIFDALVQSVSAKIKSQDDYKYSVSFLSDHPNMAGMGIERQASFFEDSFYFLIKGLSPMWSGDSSWFSSNSDNYLYRSFYESSLASVGMGPRFQDNQIQPPVFNNYFGSSGSNFISTDIPNN